MKSFTSASCRSLLLASLASMATAQTTTRVNVSSSGVQAMGGGVQSSESVISGNGRYIAFNSLATNLVAGDTNSTYDVFVHDRMSGATERVSVDSAEVEANAASTSPGISDDGRYVVYRSSATNLAAGDSNGVPDLYLRDRTLGTTARVSLGAGGVQPNADCSYAHICGNGNFVTFSSAATNLVAGDSNAVSDIFVRDIGAGTTTRVSISTASAQANGASFNSAISDDGRYVAFSSGATNLVGADTNALYDVFVRDRTLSTTTRVSLTVGGAQANDYCDSPCISGDGRYVGYTSSATNLVGGDTNAVADIFRFDRNTSAVVRASLSSVGVQGNASSSSSSLSLDGRYMVLRSNASNLVASDLNAQPDIFRRDMLLSTTALASLDTAGNQANSYSYCGGYGPSLSSDGRYVVFYGDATNLVAGDTNSDWDIFLRDTLAICPPVVAYCVAKINSAGCVPSVSSAGVPTISNSSTFFVTAHSVLNQKLGHMFWGQTPSALPFYGGTKCVAAPTLRTPNQNSGGSAAGNDCTGAYSFQFDNNYMLAQGLTAGDAIYCQFWSRDPADPKTVGLTDGLSFTICP